MKNVRSVTPAIIPELNFPHVLEPVKVLVNFHTEKMLQMEHDTIAPYWVTLDPAVGIETKGFRQLWQFLQIATQKPIWYSAGTHIVKEVPATLRVVKGERKSELTIEFTTFPRGKVFLILGRKTDPNPRFGIGIRMDL